MKITKQQLYRKIVDAEKTNLSISDRIFVDSLRYVAPDMVTDEQVERLQLLEQAEGRA